MSILVNKKNYTGYSRTFLRKRAFRSIMRAGLFAVLCISTAFTFTSINTQGKQIDAVKSENPANLNTGTSALSAYVLADEVSPIIKNKIQIDEQNRLIENVTKERAAEEERLKKEKEKQLEGEKRKAALVSKSGKTESYKKEIVLLEKIVMAEAGNQPHDGKVAVANVILNRVHSKYYPNTVTEIIYQASQFSPVNDGRLAKAVPNVDTMKAVNEALNGKRVVGEGVFYFMNPNIAEDLSVAKSKTLVKRIGDHCFYR